MFAYLCNKFLCVFIIQRAWNMLPPCYHNPATNCQARAKAKQNHWWTHRGTEYTHTYPHRGFSTVGLLQPEDLSNHVFCGGVQQDTSGSQSHHYISAHWRQAHRNGIRAYEEKRVISLTGWHPSPCFILTASSFPSSIPIMYDMPCSFLNGVEKNKETCTSTNFVRHFLAASILPLRQWSSSRNKRLRLRSSPVPAPYMSRPYHKLLPSSTIFVAGWKANKIFPITTITDVQTIAFLTEGWVLR